MVDAVSGGRKARDAMRDNEPKTTGTLEELLQQGLKAYGQGEVDRAIAAWRQVLVLAPDHQQARDYLETAGFTLDVQGPPAPVIDLSPHQKKASILAQQIKALIAERRYDHALALLHDAKRARPDRAAEIGRSIQLVKNRLVLKQLRTIGSLDQVVDVHVAPEVLDRLDLDVTARDFLEHIDGESSVGDLLRVSVMERHESLGLLLQLNKLGVIGLREPALHLPVEGAEGGREATRLYSGEGSAVPAPVEEVRASSPPAVADPTFDELFRQATKAYLQGQRDEALQGFLACARLRPEDLRVKHNIQRLEEQG